MIARTHLRLSQLLRRLGKVQDVIDYLERQTQMLSVVIHRLFNLHRGVTKYSRGPAASSYKRCCLVKGLVQVLLESDVGIEEASRLADLSVGEVSNDLTDKLDNLS